MRSRQSLDEIARHQDIIRSLGLGARLSQCKSTKLRTISTVKALARLHGAQVAIADVESFDARTQHSKDAFGILDAIAVDHLTRGIQACGTDWQPHITKLADECAKSTKAWLSSPHRTLELWGWRKVKRVKKNGDRGVSEMWTPQVQIITADFLWNNGPEIFLTLDKWTDYLKEVK